MTCVEIRMVLHIYVFPAPCKEMLTPAAQRALKALHRYGLTTRAEVATDKNGGLCEYHDIELTDKGENYVKKLKETAID